jgi:hypothetical protein
MRPWSLLQAVRMAKGDALVTVPLSTVVLDHRTGRLHLSGVAPGHAVEVDYLGERVHNVVGGAWLDDELQPSSKPGPIKLITVEEAYADTTNRMALSVLRMKDKP